MKKILLFILIGVALNINIFAQHPPVRIEFAVVENATPFTVINLGEQGVLVMMMQTNLNDSEPSRWIILYNEYLQRKWAVNLNLPNVYSFKSYNIVGDSLTFVLSSLPDQIKSDQFAIVKINLNTGEYKHTYLNFPSIPKCEILNSSVTQNILWFLAKDKNSIRLNKYNLQTQEWQSKNLDLPERQEFIDYYIDSIQQRHHLLFRSEKFTTPNLIYMEVDSSLKIIYTTQIGNNENGKRLVDAKIQNNENGKLWLIGVYNNSDLKIQTSTYHKGVISNGIFASMIENGSVQNFNYLPYQAFNKFDTLLSRPFWFEYNKSKEKSKGKDVDYQSLVYFKLKKEQNKCVFLAQSYQCNETTISEMYYDYYGRMVPQTRVIFEGFSYHDVMMVSIDSSAQIRADWIGNFGASPPLQKSLGFIIDAQFQTPLESYVLLNQNNFVYYHYNFSQNKFERDQIKLESLSLSDQIESSWNDQILQIQKGKFIAYGYQSIKNPTQAKTLRNVFYMTLIEITP